MVSTPHKTSFIRDFQESMSQIFANEIFSKCHDCFKSYGNVKQVWQMNGFCKGVELPQEDSIINWATTPQLSISDNHLDIWMQKYALWVENSNINPLHLVFI